MTLHPLMVVIFCMVIVALFIRPRTSANPHVEKKAMIPVEVVHEGDATEDAIPDDGGSLPPDPISITQLPPNEQAEVSKVQDDLATYMTQYYRSSFDPINRAEALLYTNPGRAVYTLENTYIVKNNCQIVQADVSRLKQTIVKIRIYPCE